MNLALRKQKIYGFKLIIKKNLLCHNTIPCDTHILFKFEGIINYNVL